MTSQPGPQRRRPAPGRARTPAAGQTARARHAQRQERGRAPPARARQAMRGQRADERGRTAPARSRSSRWRSPAAAGSPSGASMSSSNGSRPLSGGQRELERAGRGPACRPARSNGAPTVRPSVVRRTCAGSTKWRRTRMRSTWPVAAQARRAGGRCADGVVQWKRVRPCALPVLAEAAHVVAVVGSEVQTRGARRARPGGRPARAARPGRSPPASDAPGRRRAARLTSAVDEARRRSSRRSRSAGSLRARSGACSVVEAAVLLGRAGCARRSRRCG